MLRFIEKKYVLLGLSLILLNGCAVMNKKDCMTANWSQLGFADGSRGLPASYFATRRDACAQYGVWIDQAGYLQGRRSGLQHYCRAGQGYQAGRSGKSYHGVCSGAAERAFLRAYRQGKRIYEQQQTVDEFERDLRRLQDDIDRKTTEKSRLEGDLIGAQQTETRSRLLLELNRVNQAISDARAEQSRLRLRYQQAQRHLQRLNQQAPNF